MNDTTPIHRSRAARVLIGALALCMAVPLEASREQTEAAKVAKKVAKARDTTHDVEEQREALQDFQEDVAEYAELHAHQLAKLDAGEAGATQSALAHAITLKRARAKQGDIFESEVQPLFRRLIAEQLEGADALAARKAVSEGDPTKEADPVTVLVRVNAEYPRGAPRSTVPSSVLLTLPALPECLQYRFVGRDLILLDSVAQIIVDFLPMAAPEFVTP